MKRCAAWQSVFFSYFKKYSNKKQLIRAYTSKTSIERVQRSLHNNKISIQEGNFSRVIALLITTSLFAHERRENLIIFIDNKLSFTITKWFWSEKRKGNPKTIGELTPHTSVKEKKNHRWKFFNDWLNKHKRDSITKQRKKKKTVKLVVFCFYFFFRFSSCCPFEFVIVMLFQKWKLTASKNFRLDLNETLILPLGTFSCEFN